MVTFTPDGRRVVVANEGEPEGYCAGQVDPEGSISVIDVSKGVARAKVRTADFTSFNGRAKNCLLYTSDAADDCSIV